MSKSRNELFRHSGIGRETLLSYNIDAFRICNVFTARCYAERGYEIACRLSVRPSVCLSVTFRYRDHIGWNSSKTISQPNSIRLMRSLTATWAIWCNGNTPKIMVEWGWGQKHKKAIYRISETVQDRTKVTITD